MSHSRVGSRGASQSKPSVFSRTRGQVDISIPLQRQGVTSLDEYFRNRARSTFRVMSEELEVDISTVRRWYVRWSQEVLASSEA